MILFLSIRIYIQFRVKLQKTTRKTTRKTTQLHQVPSLFFTIFNNKLFFLFSRFSIIPRSNSLLYMGGQSVSLRVELKNATTKKKKEKDKEKEKAILQ